MVEAAKLFKAKLKASAPMQVIPGKVIAVDEANYTCTVTPTDGGADYHNVRLRAVVDTQGLGVIIVPEVNSEVNIGLISNSGASTYLVNVATPKKVIIVTASGSKIEVLSNGTVLLNGDNFGGLVKLQQLEANLNALKAYAEQLNAAVVAGLNGVGVSPAASGALGATAFSTAMAGANVSFQNMENTKVKHGG